MDVLVVGGTGTVGRPTVQELARRGHAVRVLSRTRGDEPGVRHVTGDLVTGAGLAEALAGVDAVVDVSNIATLDGTKAREFFVGATRRLVAAEAVAGVRRHVTLSIVGVDRMPTGYYKAKLAQEQALAEAADAAGVRWSVLRATQFHDFAALLLGQARRGPVVVVPALTVRPVATDDVAAALADAVEQDASGLLPVLAGSQPMQLTDMVRALLRRQGERAVVVPLPVPGRGAALVPAPVEPARSGAGTFAAWLARQGATKSVP
ncbi:MAG TPA: NAD(P)H-binding protein [Kineosporiaceae bacterium]|nr:NAD(P)H-binding protein [Kineosporiaceae bacterium]